jgi:GR25 family glycosyltransferase involved in LPS biosynthesis
MDATVDNLESAWKEHGSPQFDRDDRAFTFYKGTQGCAISHYNIWKHIVTEAIPYAVVFEDDVEFHKDWDLLANLFWDTTPKDFDILYLGSEFHHPHTEIQEQIVTIPVHCTHAYIVTLKGADKLYNLCLTEPHGTFTIDCLLARHMYKALEPDAKYDPFTWYVWNAMSFDDPNARKQNNRHTHRNRGLVFQDANFLYTDIIPLRGFTCPVPLVGVRQWARRKRPAGGL